MHQLKDPHGPIIRIIITNNHFIRPPYLPSNTEELLFQKLFTIVDSHRYRKLQSAHHRRQDFG
jgi:hypothetical protein